MAKRNRIEKSTRSERKVPDRPQPKVPITLIEACQDENLFGNFFKDKDTWWTWMVFIKAIFGYEMDAKEFDFFQKCTGRTQALTEPVKEGWLVCGRRSGKALDWETCIPVPDGYKKMGELRAGDYVYGSDGAPTKVTFAHPVEHDRPCYRVTFSDGSSIVADAEHEWVTHTKTERVGIYTMNRLHRLRLKKWEYDQANRKKVGRKGRLTFLYPHSRGNNVSKNHLNWVVKCDCGTYWSCPSGLAVDRCPDCSYDYTLSKTKTTEELAGSISIGNERNHAIPKSPILLKTGRNLPIDPYVFGYWLGDGHSSAPYVTVAELETVERFLALGYPLHKLSGPYAYRINNISYEELRQLGVLHNKHIPEMYLEGSFEQRVSFLQGLMDSDGGVEGKQAAFYNTNPDIVSGVGRLLSSLGISYRHSRYRAVLNGKDCGEAHTLNFNPTFDFNPFRLSRKHDHGSLYYESRNNRYRSITNIEQVESRPVRCITVENDDGMFLAGETHVLTHNSFISSLIATYLAAFYDWTPFLAPGERGMVMVIASDRKQARVIFRYIEALMNSSPLLQRLVENHTMESFSLRGRVTIEIHSASFRTVRGYTVVAALLDEVAFFQADNSANPDKEIVEAIRPSMATVPGAMLFGLSSPYAQRGVLYDAYKNYFGKNEEGVIVWQAPTWFMNPTIPDGFFKRAYKRDPASAAAEYGAEFRKDTDAFIPEEAYDANVDEGVYERSYIPACAPYFAFVDPSGGSHDSFTLAIAHVDPESPEEYARKILDVIREYIPPFSPDDVVREMSELMKKYGLREVVGDRYSGEWVVERFREYGITYTTSHRTKSEIYKAVLPDFMSQRAVVLNHDRLRMQALNLERKSAGHGRDLIDHPRGGRDDVINAVAGALVESEPLVQVDIW